MNNVYELDDVNNVTNMVEMNNVHDGNNVTDMIEMNNVHDL